MNVTATATQFSIDALPSGTSSIDVCFDGVRAWSVDVRERKERAFDWPEALLPYLVGSTTLTIRDSATGSEIARGEVAFDDSAERTRVADDDGEPLAVNKWGLMGRTLEDTGVQQRILDRTEEVFERLDGWELRPFVVGGTLLGAVRDGSLLPHDDDADIAYLSRHTDPADVAREGFEVGRRLEDLGYEILRHSATHMQLLFRDDAGRVDHYVDVFAAFFTPDGCINQPFHVRGEMREDQMLPFGTVTIDGREFAAPADTDHWLTINYDENWRTPIPGYRLETPEPTRRRFNNWFGSYNFRREFWDDFYRGDDGNPDATWRSGAEWILGQNLESAWLIELGAGSGRLSAGLVRPGRDVIATDFSAEARARAREAAPYGGMRVEHLNLYRTESLAAPRRLGVEGAFDLVANHVLEQLGHLGRASALRLARMALRSGGAAVATLYAQHARDVSEEDPTTWHLGRHDLAVEARALGIGVEFFDIKTVPSERDRKPYGAVFTTVQTPIPPKETTMKQRLKQALSRPAAPQDESQQLRERVAELEAEVDELRLTSLRAAELLDLVEQEFTPNEQSGRTAAG